MLFQTNNFRSDPIFSEPGLGASVAGQGALAPAAPLRHLARLAGVKVLEAHVVRVVRLRRRRVQLGKVRVVVLPASDWWLWSKFGFGAEMLKIT